MINMLNQYLIMVYKGILCNKTSGVEVSGTKKNIIQKHTMFQIRSVGMCVDPVGFTMCSPAGVSNSNMGVKNHLFFQFCFA